MCWERNIEISCMLASVMHILCMFLERSVEAQRGNTHSAYISTYSKLQSRTALGGEEVGSQNGKTSKPAVIADCGQL